MVAWEGILCKNGLFGSNWFWMSSVRFDDMRPFQTNRSFGCACIDVTLSSVNFNPVSWWDLLGYM